MLRRALRERPDRDRDNAQEKSQEDGYTWADTFSWPQPRHMELDAEPVQMASSDQNDGRKRQNRKLLSESTLDALRGVPQRLKLTQPPVKLVPTREI